MRPAQMVAMILTVLVVLYPLSPGPLALYYKRHTQATMFPPPVMTFYAPIIWLCLHSKPVEHAYEWYFRVWGVE